MKNLRDIQDIGVFVSVKAQHSTALNNILLVSFYEANFVENQKR